MPGNHLFPQAAPAKLTQAGADFQLWQEISDFSKKAHFLHKKFTTFQTFCCFRIFLLQNWAAAN